MTAVIVAMQREGFDTFPRVGITVPTATTAEEDSWRGR